MTPGGPARAARPTEGWSLTVSDPGPEAEVVADRLWQLGATAVAEEGADLVAGFGDEKAAAAAAAALSGNGVQALVAPDDGAWRAGWRAFAPDIEVGPLTIRIVQRAGPAWGEAEAQTRVGRPNLVEIDPGNSFGSGHHPSTLQCLREVVRRAGPEVSMLDVGTGSGILAVAASVLGAGPVVAVDADPDAAVVGGANARANGALVGMVGGTVAAIRGAFDLVVANLGGAEAPISLAPRLVALRRPGGTLVLAGLLEEQASVVSAAYARAGRATMAVDDGWACLTITGKG
jgi:ribosomal protein L11 methyltransferase